jgi:hypothetical protein
MGNHHPEAYNQDNSHQMPFGIYRNYHHLPPNAMSLHQSSLENISKSQL